MCLAESINKWVKGKAVRGTLSPLSGLICEFVNLIGQEILHLSEKSPLAVATMAGQTSIIINQAGSWSLWHSLNFSFIALLSG